MIWACSRCDSNFQNQIQRSCATGPGWRHSLPDEVGRAQTNAFIPHANQTNKLKKIQNEKTGKA